MGLFDTERKDLNAAIVALKTEIADLKAERTAQQKITEKTAEIDRLSKEIVKLQIDKDRIVEENAREKREVTHMVGLERARQKAEAEQAKVDLEQAKKAAALDVREENLKAEREAFEKSMKFQQDRFTSEVGYLKELMGEILDRLPTVNVDRQITEKTSRSERGLSKTV